MRALLKDKYFVRTAAGVLKFAIAGGMFCFMLLKAPGQAKTIIGYAGMYIMGGQKLHEKIGI